MLEYFISRKEKVEQSQKCIRNLSILYDFLHNEIYFLTLILDLDFTSSTLFACCKVYSRTTDGENSTM